MLVEGDKYPVKLTEVYANKPNTQLPKKKRGPGAIMEWTGLKSILWDLHIAIYI